MIHQTAVIHPSVKLDASIEIGPYVVIGEGVTIGKGTHVKSHSILEGPDLKIGEKNEIGPHAHLKSHTVLGDENKVYPFSAVGCEPQDLSFKGEECKLIIGHRNTFREAVTLNRGTQKGGGVTRIGDQNLLMAYAHVAHDCIIGNGVVIANNVALAGHVEIHDGAIVGGLVGVSQFCRIGKFSYVGGCSGTTKDIPPFMIAGGGAYNIQLRGVNAIGLKRRGIPAEEIRELKEAFKVLFLSPDTFQESLKLVEKKFSNSPKVKELIEFIKNSKPGVAGIEKDSNGQEEKSRRHWRGVSRELSH